MNKPIYLSTAAFFLFSTVVAVADKPSERPNILYVISDDQSWPHAGAYGYTAARTPAFDRIADEGVLFNQAFAPNRWPAGAPQPVGDDGQLLPLDPTLSSIFADSDPGPSRKFLLEYRDDTRFKPYFLYAVGKRPTEELYDINADPGCLVNLAQNPDYAEVREELAAKLDEYLRKTGDPRVVGPDYDIFESYLRYGQIRKYLSPEEEPEEWSEFKMPSTPTQ